MSSKSISISWIVIFRPRLFIMTLFAQCLQVVPVPEQLLVATVWGDVDNHCRLYIPWRLFLHAQHTQRMCLQVFPAGLLPLPSIPALCG